MSGPAAELLWIAGVNTVIATALALLALAADRLLKSPGLAHCLWLLVLLKLITPPLVEVPLPPLAALRPAVGQAATVHLPTGASAPAPASIAPAVPAENPRETPAAPAWPRWLLGLWLAGAALTLTLALTRALRFHLRLRDARPASESTRSEAGHLARRLGLRRIPGIRLLPGRLSPMLWALFGRAQILFPERLDRTLPIDQKRTLIAHELAHLVRRDHWVRNLELVVRALYWWNPLVAWFCGQLRDAEEACCDNLVLRSMPEAASDYAEALVSTLAFLNGPSRAPLAASGAASTLEQLKRRLTMITHADDTRSLPAYGRLAIFGLALLVLPLFPTFAERPGDNKRRRAALERGAKLLEAVGRGRDAKIVREFAHQGEQGETVAALKRAAALMKKMGREADSDLLWEHAKRLASKRHHPKGLASALKRAAMLLEVVDRPKEARLVWELLKKGHHGKKRHARKKGDDAKLWAIWKKLQHAVEKGELTEQEAHAKMAAIKKQWAARKPGEAERRERAHDAELVRVKEKIWGAYEAGKITRREAEEKWAAYLKWRAQGKKHHAREKGAEAELEAVWKKLQHAVRTGKISKEKAHAIMASIKKKWAAEHAKKYGK